MALSDWIGFSFDVLKSFLLILLLLDQSTSSLLMCVHRVQQKLKHKRYVQNSYI